MTTDTELRTLAEAQQRRLVAGATFPDYELTGHDRRRYRLSDVQGTDPMILILSRGHYCPKNFQQHRLLVDFYPRIAVSYTKIVTISTDTIYQANEMRASLGAQWLFLTDPARKVQKDNGYWFWGRPSPDELWRDLREVSRHIRPDWDLSAPELRANWNGDKTMHYPYVREEAVRA